MNTKLDDIFSTNNEIIQQQQSHSEDLSSELMVSALLAKSYVPYSHRRVANNFVVMRQLCQFQVVQPRITNVERTLLTKYAFNTLENTTISKVNEEIKLLKDWATSTDDNLRNDSNEILRIRVKELKFILSYNNTTVSEEMFNGYKAVEAYLTNITKYC